MQTASGSAGASTAPGNRPGIRGRVVLALCVLTNSQQHLKKSAIHFVRTMSELTQFQICRFVVPITPQSCPLCAPSCSDPLPILGKFAEIEGGSRRPRSRLLCDTTFARSVPLSVERIRVGSCTGPGCAKYPGWGLVSVAEAGGVVR